MTQQKSEAPGRKLPAAAAQQTRGQMRKIEADGDDGRRHCGPGEILHGQDRYIHARMGDATGGISLIGLTAAWADWVSHLMIAPGKQIELASKAVDKWRRIGAYAGDCVATGKPDCPCIEPLAQDRRFREPEWQSFPYNLLYQSFLLTQQWWHNATTSVNGVSARNENLVEFYSRQALDMVSPSNFIATNPVLLDRTMKEGGQNLLRGMRFLQEDMLGSLTGKPHAGVEDFKPGVNIAATKGKVVFRNRLFELIQYAPRTAKVHAEPVLIVPAWIMKYYILDLSPENSMIGHLVDQGFTVFCISWKNPDADYRDVSFDDYRQFGVMKAIDAALAISGAGSLHAVGYCLGGTLLSIAAATMAREADDRLASVTFFAAQADFDEAGELSLFVNESQLSLTEDMMWRDGYLDQNRMAGAFRLLRSQDLIWSAMVREYLLGERAGMSDLEAWSRDATRMPYRMHADYLRKLFLNNDLAEGRFESGGDTIILRDVTAPAFVMATERDHIAPWHSVFKLTYMLGSQVTFCLASGGHNTGVVSPPGSPRARYRIRTDGDELHESSPDDWMAATESVEGSWWPAWTQWLVSHSHAMREPPPMGNPALGYTLVGDAPGEYVLEK